MTTTLIKHWQIGQPIGTAVVGLDDLLKELEAFPEKVSKRIVSRALKDAANILVHATRNEAPARTGALRRSVRATTVKEGRRGPVVLVLVGGKRTRTNRKTKEQRTEDAYYASWVEFGTKRHEISVLDGKRSLFFGGRSFKKVMHPGAQANGFYGRAIQSTAVHSTDMFANRVSALLSQARSVKNL